MALNAFERMFSEAVTTALGPNHFTPATIRAGGAIIQKQVTQLLDANGMSVITTQNATKYQRALEVASSIVRSDLLSKDLLELRDRLADG